MERIKQIVGHLIQVAATASIPSCMSLVPQFIVISPPIFYIGPNAPAEYKSLINKFERVRDEHAEKIAYAIQKITSCLVEIRRKDYPHQSYAVSRLWQSSELVVVPSLHRGISVRSHANRGRNMTLFLCINRAHCMSKSVSKPLQKTLHETSQLELTYS